MNLKLLVIRSSQALGFVVAVFLFYLGMKGLKLNPIVTIILWFFSLSTIIFDVLWIMQTKKISQKKQTF